MMYERIIQLSNNTILGIDNKWFFNEVNIFNDDYINVNFNDLYNFYSNNFKFNWDINDLIIFYKANLLNKCNIFFVNNFDETIVFKKNLLADFLIKYTNIHKNRFNFWKILDFEIKNYLVSVDIYNKFFKPKINIDINNIKNNYLSYYNKNWELFYNERIYINIWKDYHILKFDKKLIKKNKKLKIKKISNYVGKNGLLNYISSYKIEKNNIDIFLLNLSLISYLKEKPIIVKWMDKNKDLSIIKWFAEWIERYSSTEMLNDKFKYLKHNSNFLKFSNLFLWKDFNSTILENNFYWFPIYLIDKITNKYIEVNKKSLINIPVDIILFYKKYENNFWYVANSNWTATHDNYYEAFINSYYELIERDSIALTYYFKLSPKLIEIDDLNYKNKINFLKDKYNYEFYFFSLNYLYGINVTLCIWKNLKKEIPYIFAWAWSDKNFIKSFEKSLNEVLYLIDISSKNNYTDFLKSKKEKFKKLEIYDTKDHILYYNLPENFKEIEFLFKNKNCIKFSEIMNLKEKDFLKLINNDNIYIANLTTKFWYKNNIYTIKSFSEKYIPFWFWRNDKLPISKLNSRLNTIKSFLIENWIFDEKRLGKYFDKNKDFLHFLW